MKFFRRSLLLALLAAAFLSSCSTLCCNKASARIEADIAMATEKKEDVEAAQKNAYKRIAWAKDINLESDFPEKFGDAMGSLRPADLAYDNVKYATAKRLYLEVSEILSDEFMAKALECRNERAKVEMAIKEALEACADSLAPQRFKDAQDLYIKAQALKAADDLPNALAACRKAAAAFNYAAEYSRTIKLRDSIRDCQALKDYSKEYLQAEEKILEDEALWKHGTVKDYALGISILHEAGRQYSWIAEQCRKLKEEQRLEAERMLLAAEKLAAEKAAADGALACAKDGMSWAETNSLGVDYADDYSKAKAELAEAEATYAAGNYICAATSATKVCEFFSDQYRTAVLAERARIAAEKAAAEKLASEKAAADGALACAKDGMAWAETNSLGVGYPDDYTRAKAQLAEAEAAYTAGDFVGARDTATKVCEFFSDQYRAAVLADRARIAAEKMAAEKLASEKAAADGALACAKDGMSWAETKSLGIDYADDYSRAKAQLAEAMTAYEAGNYVGAGDMATKVCEFFSDQYRAAVLAERARIAAEKMAAEKLASEKAAADGALACAKDGMSWAETNSLGVDYADDYSRAKAQLAEAMTAYEAGNYVGAGDMATKVCEFFSDQYRAAVLAERARIAAEKAAAEKAAAEKLAAEKALADRLAAEKAAADGALACAKDGMSWAETNSLGVDYPDDYTRAKTQLAEASTVYEAGDYVGAGAMATKVCEFFSDQYRAAVLAERARIAAEKAAAEKAAAEKLAAEKALADRLAAEKASQERAEKERLAREKAEPTKPVVKTSSEFFSPDDDGIDDLISFDTDLNKDTEVKNWVLEVFEEYIVDPSAKTYSVAKRSFRTWTGNGMPPARIAWDGKSDKDELVQSGTTYPYAFTYTDKQNRTTGTQGVVMVGIIAQKSGDTISIKLPSLVFRADKSDFLDLDPHVVERNNLLIVKLADSLKKYSDYHITVEGHANNIGKMIGYSQARIDEEEKQQVLPLSAGRAEKLKAMLIDQGIDPSLISVIGYGSSKPVVSFTDVVNRWKNRRVEFTLTKKNSR